ncbi:VOC family protein [Ancylobacter sp. MQZ15Z-1]|uniref:VOC family protein n=1 Tax=Ancylobacter mangrovi TaxID=2972472 RepID=A0A9X2PHH7_9HYPH|nr:VOC family protein [Ancylobacter mangrovi]MCS0497176.1 VOC family protein [Ancylobacter mangrovi]
MSIACRFDHVHLRLDDYIAAADWFCDRLGARVVNRIDPPARPKVDLDLGGVKLTLSPRAAGGAVGGPGPIDHLAFVVADVKAAAEELVGKGAVIVEPVTMARPGVWTVFIEGPERIKIELLQRM